MKSKRHDRLMERISFSSPGWDDDLGEEVPFDADRAQASREDGARFAAVTLTCLSVLPAALLTVAFFLARLPPLDRDDYPDWAAPTDASSAPWLLLFLLPPLVTGAVSRLVGGRGAFYGFWHYGMICFLVMVPFLIFSAVSFLG